MIPPLAIETRGLTRRFGARTAVDALNLQVPCGCICGFLGPNGAGKTTTIRLLLGLLRPTSGAILLHGEMVSRARAELRRSVGALVEGPSLYPHLTGRENLEVSRRLLNVSAGRVTEVLEIFKLTPDADRVVRAYSLGMRQRLALALALLGEPRLLVLDEPANGLDPGGVHDLRNLLRRLVQQRGVTIFLSSHLLSEVEQIADRIAILNQGRLLFDDTLASFQAKQGAALVLRVDRTGAAKTLLQDRGWTAEERSDGTLWIQTREAEDAAAINALLVNAGISVHQISREQPSLETLFLSATEGARERPSA